MKKLLILLVFLLAIGLISAQSGPPIPSPIKIVVSVNGHPINYADTTVTNKDTGEVLTVQNVGGLNIQKGVGLFDLSDFQMGFTPKFRIYPGDTIKVVACNLHPLCTQSFTISDLNPRVIIIEIVDETIPREKYILRYQCEDGSWMEDSKENCPIVIPPVVVPPSTVIIEKIFCSDGTEVSNSNECLETKEQVLGYTKTQLGVTAGVTAGFAALVVYFALKRKQRARAKKMLDTRISKLKKK